MSKCRIYLSGAHSTGKTTILNDLKPHLNLQFEEEIARRVIRKFSWKRDDFLPETQPENFLKLNEEILRRQIQTDEENGRISKDFIADRCIDPLIYVQKYIGDDALRKLRELPGVLEWTDRLKTALIFVIKPQKECIVDDEVRLSPKLEELDAFHNSILQEYKLLGIPVFEITDLDRQKRKAFILDKIQQRFPGVLISFQHPG
ncbi:unnamed protein product [Mytilus coruscus]|uniref:NadR/Ttd14 AAA domain-containing protein n=1 Tax=Mytilus coruscus TaxID=42192 RepID=A0A6J8EEW8_MYTCO|nr:unnamed protein product [Mytilus coruscus]